MRKFIFVCLLGVLYAFTAIGQEEIIKRMEQNPIVEDINSIIADKKILKRELIIIDSMALTMRLEEEDKEFPADDLYAIWDTKLVNPYKDVVIPDSFSIDISSFHIPFEGRITSKFGPRRRRFHYGTDIKLQVGDTVRAAFDGKVRIKAYERRGYGYYLVLRHPNGLETVYGHLSKFLIVEDDVVKAGDPIALGGNTGRSSGSHLHLEIRFLGKAINPQEIIDFENATTLDEVYVFRKETITADNKYIAGNGQPKYHKVRSGDTLGRIARKYGITVKELCSLNNIKSTTTLRIGRTIRYN